MFKMRNVKFPVLESSTLLSLTFPKPTSGNGNIENLVNNACEIETMIKMERDRESKGGPYGFYMSSLS